MCAAAAATLSVGEGPTIALGRLIYPCCGDIENIKGGLTVLISPQCGSVR